MDYRLYLVRLFSFKWEESLAFYRDTIGLPVYFEDGDLGWAQLDPGAAYLGLERCAPEDPKAAALVGRFAGVSIEVADIDATYAALRSKGVAFSAPPQRQPWGGTLAHFHDPDGNTITLLGGVPGG